MPEITLNGADEERDKELEKSWFDKVPEPPQELGKNEHSEIRA